MAEGSRTSHLSAMEGERAGPGRAGAAIFHAPSSTLAFDFRFLGEDCTTQICDRVKIDERPSQG